MGDRTDFNETWLSEMPSGIGAFGVYPQLVSNINDQINIGTKVIKLPNNLNKIVRPTTLIYWYGDEKNIILGTELKIAQQGLIVSLTAKNPSIKKGPPYASQLYNAILDDTKRSLRLLSDNDLSDEGFNIWKRLFDDGCNVSIYDLTNSGQSFIPFKTFAQMQQYFGHNRPDLKKIQYVLSESGDQFGDIIAIFGIRRARELCGFSLED
jgi:hypothetical protein